jgi:hypothetical protein
MRRAGLETPAKGTRACSSLDLGVYCCHARQPEPEVGVRPAGRRAIREALAAAGDDAGDRAALLRGAAGAPADVEAATAGGERRPTPERRAFPSYSSV